MTSLRLSRDLIVKWYGHNRVFCNGRIVVGSQILNFIGGIALVVVPFIFFWVNFYVSFIPDFGVTAEIIEHILLDTAAALSLLFMFITGLRDPGIIPSTELDKIVMNHLNLSADLNFDRNYYYRELQRSGFTFVLRHCTTCNNLRPMRTGHCSKCNTCVYRFDHHCYWLGTDIGYRNHGYFYLVVLFVAVFIFFIIAFSVINGVAAIVIFTRLKQNGGLIFGKIVYYILILGTGVYMLYSMGELIRYHIGLISKGILTKEDLRSNMTSDHPYNHKSFRKNLQAAWNGMFAPSLLQIVIQSYQELLKDPESSRSLLEGVSKDIHYMQDCRNNQKMREYVTQYLNGHETGIRSASIAFEVQIQNGYDMVCNSAPAAADLNAETVNTETAASGKVHTSQGSPAVSFGGKYAHSNPPLQIASAEVNTPSPNSGRKPGKPSDYVYEALDTSATIDEHDGVVTRLASSTAETAGQPATTLDDDLRARLRQLRRNTPKPSQGTPPRTSDGDSPRSVSTNDHANKSIPSAMGFVDSPATLTPAPLMQDPVILHARSQNRYSRHGNAKRSDSVTQVTVEGINDECDIESTGTIGDLANDVLNRSLSNDSYGDKTLRRVSTVPYYQNHEAHSPKESLSADKAQQKNMLRIAKMQSILGDYIEGPEPASIPSVPSHMDVAFELSRSPSADQLTDRPQPASTTSTPKSYRIDSKSVGSPINIPIRTKLVRQVSASSTDSVI